MGDDRMTIFVSNYINHHQLPFCQAMLRELSGEFLFIQMEPMVEERVNMGWGVDVKKYPFVMCYQDAKEECQRLIEDSECVIFGGWEDENIILPRLEQGKFTLRYSERIYKEGQWKFISPRGLIKKYHDHVRFRKEEVYLLCAGGYVASDFQLIHAYPNHMFTWGYFPEFVPEDMETLFQKKEAEGKTGEVEILWAGRMIPYKHPELAMKAVGELVETNPNFHFTMIGEGEELENVKKIATQYGITDKVSFPGFMKPTDVREYMRKADIFLFTSDFGEGWGAVLNEAMNSGCACIAGSGIGAVPSMIRHGWNGYVYENGNGKELLTYLKELAGSKAKRRVIGQNAYISIQKYWNADYAAKELAKFIKNPGEYKEPSVGPMSKAPVISPNKGYVYTRR